MTGAYMIGYSAGYPHVCTYALHIRGLGTNLTVTYDIII